MEALKRRSRRVTYFGDQFQHLTSFPSRKVFRVLRWLRKHGEERGFRVTVVSANEQFLDQLRADGFEALLPQRFFQKQFTSSELLRLVDSLARTMQAAKSEFTGVDGKYSRETRWNAHWSAEEVQAGLSRGELVKGVLRVDPRSKEGRRAWVDDILLADEAAQNRAVDNDVVAVLPNPERAQGLGSRSGVVVAVLKARWRPYVATLSAMEVEAIQMSAYTKSDAVVVPMDKRVPKIYVTISSPAALVGQRFVVAIDDWPIDSR